MTSASIEARARRPQQHEALMQEMQNEAKFPTYRDILLFAAAVGFYQQRRVQFTTSSGDPIRYDVLIAPGFSDTLINMIAANEISDDPESWMVPARGAHQDLRGVCKRRSGVHPGADQHARQR